VPFLPLLGLDRLELTGSEVGERWEQYRERPHNAVHKAIGANLLKYILQIKYNLKYTKKTHTYTFITELFLIILIQKHSLLII